MKKLIQKRITQCGNIKKKYIYFMLKWNVITYIWRGSNVSVFAAIFAPALT